MLPYYSLLKMCFIHPASCKRPLLWNGQTCFLLSLSRWSWIPICLHYLPLARGSCGLSHKSKRSPVLSQEVKETLRSTRMHPCSGPESFSSSHHVHSLVCKHGAQGLSANTEHRTCLQTWGPGLVCKHGAQDLSANMGCRACLQSWGAGFLSCVSLAGERFPQAPSNLGRVLSLWHCISASPCTHVCLFPMMRPCFLPFRGLGYSCISVLLQFKFAFFIFILLGIFG